MASAKDPSVAGFKSVVCYRTGLDVSAVPDPAAEAAALLRVGIYKQLQSNVPLRLADKPLNDLVVRTTLEVAAEYNKPGMVPFLFPSDSVKCPFFVRLLTFTPLAVQFHTGLGDADITLTRASPAHLQPLIAANPRTIFVLLHASYPYMREGGYLTAVYKNVYFDIGEVFPAVSRGGQEALIRQVLELAPTNKIMWSSELFLIASLSVGWKLRGLIARSHCRTGDGHWWPETYYLGSIQARRALASVRIYVPICLVGRVGTTLNEVIYPSRCCKTLSKQTNSERRRQQGLLKTSYFIRRIGFTTSIWSRCIHLIDLVWRNSGAKFGGATIVSVRVRCILR